MLVSSAFLVLAALASAAPAPRPMGLVKTFPLRQRRVTAQQQHPQGRSLDMVSYANDQQYEFVLQVGTPPQDMRMNIDTGSAKLWVAGTCGDAQVTDDDGNTVANLCQTMSNRFNQNASTSFRPAANEDNAGYGVGQAKGARATDTVGADGHDLRGFEFMVADSVVGMPWDVAWDLGGMVGMNTNSDWFTALVETGTLKDNLFGMYFRRTEGNTKNEHGAVYCDGGSLTIGGVDSSVIDGDLAWVGVANPNSQFWIVNAESMRVEGQGSVQNFNVLLDSGSANNQCPQEFADMLYSHIPGATHDGGETWSFPCDSKIPAVTVTIGGKQFPLAGADLVRGSGTTCTGVFRNTTMDTGNAHYLFAPSVTKNFYTAYRTVPNMGVGFGKLTAAANGADLPAVSVASSAATSLGAGFVTPAVTSLGEPVFVTSSSARVTVAPPVTVTVSSGKVTVAPPVVATQPPKVAPSLASVVASVGSLSQ